MPRVVKQMSEQEEGEGGSEEEFLGARGGGRGWAVLSGGMRAAAGASSTGS